MTLEILETRIAQSSVAADSNAEKCKELIEVGDLGAAIEYCKSAGLEPPQCSLEANSENAQKLRSLAGKKLSDTKWWRKALEQLDIRRYEGEQIAQGKVTNYISDGLSSYIAKKKKR